MRSKLIERLDAVFSKYIRIHKSDDDGYCSCITCGKKEYWKDVDAGHFIPRKHMATRYDVDNVYPQCRVCNRLNYGEEETFSKAIGSDMVAHLTILKNSIAKMDNYDLRSLIAFYSDIIASQYKHKL